MSTPPTHHDDQRHIDFDLLAPLIGLAVLLSIIAIIFGLVAMNGSESSEAKSSSTASSAAGGDAGAGATTSFTSDESAAPGKADFTMKRFDPITKPVQPGHKTFDLVTTEKNVKVGDKVYRMWMFNGSVPGPVLRAVVGDKITIRIHNDKTSKYVHSVDYHASRLSLGGGFEQVAPGKDGTFEFTAEYPGVFMYHCATAPVVHHIGMGMYGMLIVQPKGGFGKPMPEFAITQSELYENQKAIELKQPAAMAFNGIPMQYMNDPIKVKADQNIRLFVLNAGPSELSSFHVIGTVIDKAQEDGNPSPFNTTVGRQTIPLAASGATMIEAKLVGEGKFPFVTHQFNHAAMGAVGMFLAGDGQPGPGAAANPSENGHH